MFSTEKSPSQVGKCQQLLSERARGRCPWQKLALLLSLIFPSTYFSLAQTQNANKKRSPLWLLFTCTQTFLSPERGKGIEKTTDANRFGVFQSCIFLYLFHGHNAGHNKGSEVKICAQMPNNVDHNGGRLPAVAAQEPDGIIHILFPLGLWGSQVDSYLESLSLPKLPSWLAFIMKPSQISPTFSFRVCNNGRLKIVQQLFYSTDDVTSAHNGTRMKSSFLLFCQDQQNDWRQIFKTNVI